MAYTPHNWVDVSDPGSPPPDAPELNAANLNQMEAGIVAANQSLPQYVARTSNSEQDVNGVTITGPCLVIVIDSSGAYQGTYYDDGAGE